jgi:hypothetical protein
VSYYHDRMASRSTNRLLPEVTLRDLTLGMRVCADVPACRDTVGLRRVGVVTLNRRGTIGPEPHIDRHRRRVTG